MKRWLALVFITLMGSGHAYAQGGMFDNNNFTTRPANFNAAHNAEKSAEIHTELGAGFFSRGQYSVALDELHKAINANNNYAPAYDVLGLVYMALNEDKPAEENFHRALNIAPNDPDIHNNYGWFLYNRSRYNEAMEQFKLSIANPLYAKPQSALTNAGLCALKMGNSAEAQTYFEKSLGYDGNQPEAIFELAQMYYQQQRYAEAKMMLDKLSTDNTTPNILWLGLRIARKMNDSNIVSSDDLLLRNRYPNAPETQLLLQGKFN